MTKEKYEVGDIFIPATAVRVLKRWEVAGINWYEIERVDGELFDSNDGLNRSEFTRSVSQSELGAMHETLSVARVERLEKALRIIAEDCLSTLLWSERRQIIDLLDMEDA